MGEAANWRNKPTRVIFFQDDGSFSAYVNASITMALPVGTGMRFYCLPPIRYRNGGAGAERKDKGFNRFFRIPPCAGYSLENQA